MAGWVEEIVGVDLSVSLHVAERNEFDFGNVVADLGFGRAQVRAEALDGGPLWLGDVLDGVDLLELVDDWR